LVSRRLVLFVSLLSWAAGGALPQEAVSPDPTPVAPAGVESVSLYLAAGGRVHPISAVRLGETIYAALDDAAPHLGLAIEVKEKGLVVRSEKSYLAFSEDFSAALVGSHLYPVRPVPVQAGERLYVPLAFLREHLPQLVEAPFAFHEETPRIEMRTLVCRLRMEDSGGEGAPSMRWVLSFEERPAFTTTFSKQSAALFFEGTRFRMPFPKDLPSDLEFRHESLPLGDRFEWRWGEDKALEGYVEARGEKEIALTLEPMGAVHAASARTEPRPLRVVILDPGHGGEAAGAVGKSGLREKDLVLWIALGARGLLAAEGLEVYLTREVDADMPLMERAEFANAKRGDVFVSIHANASLRPTAVGAETFFMSYEALDDESRQLSLLENQGIIVPSGRGAAAAPDPLEVILWHMAQAQYLDQSSRLAEEIQARLNAHLGTPNRGIKQAPFAVLMGTAMPAVLVEVGFLSNPEEERLLERDGHRQKIARALAESILAFKRDWDARTAAAPKARPHSDSSDKSGLPRPGRDWR
jgi:N-acetylmuramoyl-L-alanine amidase